MLNLLNVGLVLSFVFFNVPSLLAFNYKCCSDSFPSTAYTCRNGYNDILLPEFQAQDMEAARLHCGYFKKSKRVKFKIGKKIKLIDTTEFAVKREDEEKIYGVITTINERKYIKDITEFKNPRQFFFWPQSNPGKRRQIGRSMKNYASKVDSCLHVPDHEMNLGQFIWLDYRQPDKTNFFKNLPLSLKEKRDQFCEDVKETQLKVYDQCQYGNCAEGSEIGYCLAHEKGILNILKCHSENDHAFTMYLNEKSKQICILDRWDLNGGNHFCGFSLVNNEVIHPQIQFRGDWYQKLDCYDPLDEDSFHTKDYKEFRAKTWLEILSNMW